MLNKSKCTNVLNALHQCYKSQVGPKLVNWRNFGSESKVDLEQDLGAHLHICVAGSHMDVVYRKDPANVEAGQWFKFKLLNTFSIEIPPKIRDSHRNNVGASDEITSVNLIRDKSFLIFLGTVIFALLNFYWFLAWF